MSKTEPPDDETDDEAADHVATERPAPLPDVVLSLENPAPDRTGQLVGKYRLERRLGAGGMAEVYVAVRTDHIQNRVALKLLHSFFASRQDYRRRFEQEAFILSTLNHPGIVKIVDYGVLPSGESFLVMEYLDGNSLAERLEQSPQHRLPVDAAVHLGYEVASALASAHKQGVVHRDLKPSNLMIVPDTAAYAGERVKIVDFGIARTVGVDGESLTEAGKVIGTMRYMSPEQLRGDKVNGATDVFSLGLVLFESIAGRPAFTGSGGVLRQQLLHEEAPSLRSLQSETPRALSDLVRRMLAKVATERPSMTQIEDELSRLSLTGSRSAIRSVGPSRRLHLNRRVLLGIAIALGTAVAAAAGYRLYRMIWPPQQLIRSATMVDVPEGDMQMGSTPADVQAAYSRCQQEKTDDFVCRPDMFEQEQPQRPVRISSFRIDRTLVSTADMLRFLRSVQSRLKVREDSDSHQPRFVELDGKTILDMDEENGYITFDPETKQYSLRPGTERKAIEQATWIGAALYCRSVGKRLITEAEWEYVHKLLSTEDGRKKLQGPIVLPAEIHEWVFDEFRQNYQDCGSRCVDPAVGEQPSQRAAEVFSVVRGCIPRIESGVFCRSETRGKQRTDTGAKRLGFRCVVN